MENKDEIIKNAVNNLFKNEISNYIFIYTPPKVGSTTLVSSLRISLGKKYNVIHIHDDIMLNVLTGINNISVNDILNYLSQQGKNIYVIDVYRTPIERKISEFFEKISPYHFNNTEQSINKYSIKRVSDRFNKLFPHLGLGDHYFEKYNITPISFDFNKKYIIQNINNIKYVKLRLLDSSIWDKILSNILQEDIVLINDYETDSKEIGYLYKKFKLEYKVPRNLYETIKNCKYLNLFYSSEERKDYLNSWNNKICDDFIPYTLREYTFYFNLCLENQSYNDIQAEHYFDNGCICKLCSPKRKEIFNRIKNGEKIVEKLNHNELINENIIKKNKIINDINNKINTNIKIKSPQIGMSIFNKK